MTSQNGQNEMFVEGVEGLQLYEHEFIWSGETFDYDDVVSVQFDATVVSKSVNGIPMGKSYKANLLIHLEDRRIKLDGARRFTGSLSNLGFEGLQTSFAALSRATFSGRVQRYEDQVLQKEFFHWGAYQIDKKGRLYRDGMELFSLFDGDRELHLEPFKLVVLKKHANWISTLRGLFRSDDVEIDISTDRDCFIYLMAHVLGIKFKNQMVPEKQIDLKRLYYETALRFGVLIGLADGKFEDRELTQLKRHFDLSHQTFPEAGEVLNDALSNRRNIGEVLKRFSIEFRSSQELKEHFLYGMILVAAADGSVHEDELTLLVRARLFLNIDEDTFVRLAASAGVGFKQRERDTQESDKGRFNRPKRSVGSREFHIQILGLSEPLNKDELVKSYRLLVRRYHPDLLRSQGLPEEELRRSEDMLKKINVAYASLLADFE